ncbi:MAG TPA: tRNA (N(6)-L-threonylcarbamoyladenosine(37)-C(2))-methylthiotransferase MtaB, partial [Saliniramus sp.]|nr:tRNA (N(6)-L-threonylcarbamoyladenosine(37)-C(2))-methylthiotransferase MtaB [Saliniramus sp.]
EAMFSNSLALVDACDLTHLHVFPFSPRPGTPAARMPQVERKLVKERAARLRARGEEALLRHLEREIGKTRNVLTETADTGRTEGFTPVRFAAPVAPGEIRAVTIAGHDGRVLHAA